MKYKIKMTKIVKNRMFKLFIAFLALASAPCAYAGLFKGDANVWDVADKPEDFIR